MHLFFMDPMLHGPAVKRLQEMLVEVGFQVGAIDGWFGEKTLQAVLDYQFSRNLPVSGVVDQSVWDHLEQAVLYSEELVAFNSTCPIVSIVGKHGHPKLYNKERSPRLWVDIDGVTLHQTGCVLSDKPSRWATLNAHIGVFRDGTIVLVNDLSDFIWHAQGLSHHTIGVEFNGNYPGIIGDRKTWWAPGGPMCQLTAEQIKAIPRLFDFFKSIFKANKVTWKTIHAHRQASKDRRSDPGEEIWKTVAIPWMRALEVRGSQPMDGGPTFSYGDGLPIPAEWQPAYSSSY